MKAPKYWLGAVAAAVLAASVGVIQAPVVNAGIYNSSTGVTYKEYWDPHNDWTGGCPEHGLYHANGNQFYLEPGPCTKTSSFTIPDNVQTSLKVELYVDLWRAGRNDVPGLNVKLNSGPTRLMPRGEDWSRTPLVMEIPKTEVNQGTNTITFTGIRGHIHDVALRVYHDETHPLVPGLNSDVTPPSGVALTSVVAPNGTFDPAVGGTLQVNTNTLTVHGTATGATRLEFIGKYEGYDEDNDGVTNDWHVFNRNNWNPGGKFATANNGLGGTIGHLGTDPTSPYSATADLRAVPNQTGVQLKVRAIDAAGNVRETPASAAFELARTYPVTLVRIPNFVDAGIHLNGSGPDQVSRTITMPSLAGVTSAFMLGNYWQNPFIQLNGKTQFTAFAAGEDVWKTSFRSVPLSYLKQGSNTILYKYNPNQIAYGQFVENPGPMFVLHGGAPPPALPTISISDASKLEPNCCTASMAFQLKLSAKSTKQVTVRASTSDGTAIAPGDYTTRTNVLVTFPAGVITKNFTVPIKGEKLVEPNETFTVTLSSPVNATIADGTATGTILNND